VRELNELMGEERDGRNTAWGMLVPCPSCAGASPKCFGGGSSLSTGGLLPAGLTPEQVNTNKNVFATAPQCRQ